MDKYCLLCGTHDEHGTIKTMLVLKEYFDDEGGDPTDYFMSGYTNAHLVGVVSILPENTEVETMIGAVYGEE